MPSEVLTSFFVVYSDTHDREAGIFKFLTLALVGGWGGEIVNLKHPTPIADLGLLSDVIPVKVVYTGCFR